MASRARESFQRFKKKKKRKSIKDFVISRFQEEVYPLLEDTSLQQGRCDPMPSPSGVSQQEQVGSPAEVLQWVHV